MQPEAQILQGKTPNVPPKMMSPQPAFLQQIGQIASWLHSRYRKKERIALAAERYSLAAKTLVASGGRWILILECSGE
jgi:hypothetical protein